MRTYNNCMYYSNYCASICNKIIIYKSVLSLFSLHVPLGKTRTICTWLFSACFWAWEEGHHDVGSALGAFLWQTPRRNTGLLTWWHVSRPSLEFHGMEQDVINHHQSHGRKQYYENLRSAVGVLCCVSIIIYLSLGRCAYIVETNTLEPFKRSLAKSSFRSAKQRFWRRKRMEICWGTHTRSHQDHIFKRVLLVNPFNNTTERGFWNASKSPKGLKESEVAQHNQQEIKNMLSFVMNMLWL